MPTDCKQEIPDRALPQPAVGQNAFVMEGRYAAHAKLGEEEKAAARQCVDDVSSAFWNAK